jgi:hypothetical protein
VVLAVGAALLTAALFAVAAFAVDDTSFKMVRSQSALDNDCLRNARADVDTRTVGGNQIMDVTLKHAAKNTGFTLFVIQQPNSPFGVSWYQVDLDTDNKGNGEVRVIGIFSEETLAFAPERVKAPQVDDQDAEKNPALVPVQLCIWGCGLPTQMKPRKRAARGPSRRSTATTRRASRRLAPATPPP